MAGQKHELDEDRPLWERQEAENDAAFALFREYLASRDRVIDRHGPSARYYASVWSWTRRAWEWDNHAIREELRLQQRLRVNMNDRHRRVAARAIDKVGEWVDDLDPKKLSARDAIRLLDVAARIEGNATSNAEETVPEFPDGAPASDADVPHESSFAERVAGVDLEHVELRDLARFLHQKIPRPS